MNNEPVAWMDYLEHSDVYDLNVSGRGIPLYTHPADLTDEEIDQTITNCGYEIEETVMGKFVDIEGINMYNSLCGFARAILRKAQEK